MWECGGGECGSVEGENVGVWRVCGSVEGENVGVWRVSGVSGVWCVVCESVGGE